MRLERLQGDLRVIARLLQGMSRSGNLKERLDHFYRPQAEDYDRFRERLLGGRQELVDSISLPERGRVLELGAGTGANLLRFSEAERRKHQFVLVDLCPSLLAIAQRRWRDHPNIETIEADASSFDSPTRFDVIMLSYALSMMPDYAATLQNAHRLLNRGGVLAVVDFYAWPGNSPECPAQHPLERWFWSHWFGHDGVAVNGERLQALIRQFPSHRLWTGRQSVPWLGPLQVPIFRFLGFNTGS